MVGMAQKTLQLPYPKFTEFKWAPGRQLSETDLQHCSALFSHHYGTWTKKGEFPGRFVQLSPMRLRRLLDNQYFWAALAWHDNQLVAHAFALRIPIEADELVTWITQLVVHKDYRQFGLAKALLMSIWSFSDNYAWGLVTPNPYAIRALEKATRRRCDPAQIANEGRKILESGQRHLGYINGCTLTANETESTINTNFHINLSGLTNMINRCSKDKPWKLGKIKNGEEWFAFTFSSQPEFPIERMDLDRLLANADSIARRAYEGMTLDSGHRWAAFTPAEVDYMMDTMPINPGDSLLDFGCGNGRHAIELGRRGVKVSGVDFAGRMIQRAKADCPPNALSNTKFFEDDCRFIKLSQHFDAGICVYDVIGTFPQDEDNDRILENLVAHLRPGAPLLISVMNYVPTENAARNTFNVYEEPSRLQELPPSNIMESSGQIFDPDYYLLDKETKLVYRKEQFSVMDDQLPGEFLVRDRRYMLNEIVGMCRGVGLTDIQAKFVRAGRWQSDDLLEASPNAREILVSAKKQE